MRIDPRPRSATLAVTLAAVLAAGVVRAEEFYTLASVQAVPVKGGTALRLSANGPIAYARLDDPDAPPGVVRIRLKLYGVSAVAEGMVTATAVGTVSAVPDGHGNLEVTVVLNGEPGEPVIRPGRGAQDVDITVRTQP